MTAREGKNRRLDLLLLTGLLVVMALIAGNTRLAFTNTRRVYDAVQQSVHSRQVLASLRSVLSSMKDAETGQRGYLLTGDDSYLAPYAQARRALPADLVALDLLTRDDPAVQHRLPAINAAITAKMAELAETIRLRRERGLVAAQDVVLAGVGRRSMDDLRDLVEAIEEDEERRIAQRTAQAQRSRDAAFTSGLGAGLGGMLVVLGFGVGLRRSLRTQQAAAAAVFGQKELFRTTLASIGDAVITTDLQGRVTFLNGVAETLTGWTTEDGRGRPLPEVFRIVNESTREEVDNPAGRALREGAVVGLANHTILVARDGGERAIDDSAAPIRDMEGAVQGAVLVFRDIGERRRAEAALAAADRRKDEFLAVLAHELRNPLAPLRNALQLLRLSGRDPATVERIREMMERQLRQMVRLIDDLMDVSRITNDKLELRTERVALGAVLGSALETVEPSLRLLGHDVAVSLPPQPIFVEADATRLAQAFYNLLSNAAKYTPRGGRIWLTARREDGQAVVSVKDTGSGIPPGMLARVFDMFAQVDRSAEQAREGLGIGLTLVRRIVEMHGGTVEARSEGAGRGSEFVVRLAAGQDGKGDGQPAASGQPPVLKVAGRRVLVADDNEDSAETMAMLLEALGNEVKIAHDGAQAVEQAESFRPDVALLDIGMPRVDGYEAARRIRAQDWGRSIVLVALTGWGQDEDRRRSQEAGFDRHLIKPVDIEALQEVLAGARA